MRHVVLEEETLSVEYGGKTYTKTFYKAPISIAGVVDESHPDWDDTTPFALGEFCIVPELKSIYKAAAENSGEFPPASDKWSWHSCVNSYNMFAKDESIGAKTVGTDIVMSFEFNSIDCLGLLDISFNTLEVSQLNHITGISSIQTFDGKDFDFEDFAGWCFNEVKQKRKEIIDIEWLPDSTVTLTFTGDVSIGTLGMGIVEDSGFTMVGSLMSWQSESKFNVSEFTGFRYVTRYGSVRILDVEIIFDSNSFNEKTIQIDELMDRYILWIPTEADKFSEAIDIGYLSSASVPLDTGMISQKSKIIGVPR